MLGSVREILIAGQQSQVIPYAQLRDQCVHSAKPHASPAAFVAKRGCRNVIVPVRLYEGKGTKARDDIGGRFGAGESLKEFLEHQAGCDNDFRAGERCNQCLHFGRNGCSVAPESERPDAGINQETHLRVRSDL